MTNSFSDLITVQKINEPCLVHPDWIQINLNQSDDFSQFAFSKLLTQAHDLAQSYHFSKIEIITHFDSPYSSLLSQYHFKKAFTEFKYPANQNLTLPDTNPQLSLKSNIDHFSQIKDLLIQQADFHANLAPQYYLDSQKLRWADYQTQTMSDIHSPGGRSLFLIKNKQIIGLIIGTQISHHIDIWELIIDKQYRSCGFGKYLLTHYLNQFQNKNTKEFILETQWHSPAYHWYRHLNWRPTAQSWYTNLPFLHKKTS